MHGEPNERRRRPIHLGGAALILVIVGSLIVSKVYFDRRLARARETARRIECQNNLKILVLGQNSYAGDHSGEYSEKLSDLYPKYVTRLEIFTCPSAGGPKISSKEEIDSKTGYVLLKGLTDSSPVEEVLMYERPENHRQDGGNVAYVDGQVEWLSRAELERVIEQQADSAKE